MSASLAEIPIEEGPGCAVGEGLSERPRILRTAPRSLVAIGLALGPWPVPDRIVRVPVRAGTKTRNAAEIKRPVRVGTPASPRSRDQILNVEIPRSPLSTVPTREVPSGRMPLRC